MRKDYLISNTPRYLSPVVIDYIIETLDKTDGLDFDIDSFNEWLIEKDIANKINPSAYVKSCFAKELEHGTYKARTEIKYIPAYQPLINAMREKGICVLNDDCVYLGCLWDYLLEDKKLGIDTCKKLNHQVVDYMEKGQSFIDYVNLLKNSNTLKKYEIDWLVVDERAKKELHERNELMKKFESEIRDD